MTDSEDSQSAAASEANDPPLPPTRTDNNDDDVDDSNQASVREHHDSHDEDPSQQQQQQQQQLPIEYQLYEVDLTNPEMDPLEYTFRRYVSIPKAYFWDTASDLNEYNQNLPFKIKWWHRSIYYLGECLKKAEAGGEVVANFLGLNDGPFNYVTDNITEEEMARSRATVEMRRGEQVEMELRREGVGV